SDLCIPDSRGSLVVLPAHGLLSHVLKIGEVGYRRGHSWSVLAVAWGFVEVLPNHVRILAETAERAQEIDVDRPLRAKQRAEELMARGGDNVDYNRALIALERAIIRIQVARKDHHVLSS